MVTEQVKRNRERLPADFLFQPNVAEKAEKAEVVANCDHLQNLKFSKVLPYAFTEHGAIQAANVLASMRPALLESGRDRGAAHIADGPLHIKFDLPKKVTWDQPRLNDRLQRTVAAGEDVKSYADVKLWGSEARYTNWTPTLK
jgi:hypothetical protein